MIRLFWRAVRLCVLGLLIQSSPGRDATTERDPEPPKLSKGQLRRTGQQIQAARNKLWNDIAKKGTRSGSDGMTHALREGPRKLVFDIEYNAPAALYNLDEDLAETKNLLGEASQRERLTGMEKLYREIRSSRRSTPVA